MPNIAMRSWGIEQPKLCPDKPHRANSGFHGTICPRHGFPRRRAGMRYGPPALALAGPPALALAGPPALALAGPPALALAGPPGTCPGRASGTCPGRASGTLSGISLFDSTGCSTHRPRNQLRGVATCRSGASARAVPDRWRPLKVPENRTARRLSWLDSMLFLARQRAFPGRELPAETHGYAGDPEVAPPQGDKYHRRQRRCEPADAGETERLATPGYGSERH